MTTRKAPAISPGTALALMAIYHLAMLLGDMETYRGNLRRLRANPNLSNLARALIAEGVLIKDLGWFA